MHIVERGQGDPLVLIPGIQGRWEYIRPAVDALAEFHRVITFALADEPSAGVARREPSEGQNGGTGPSIDALAHHIDAVLDELGTQRAVICGISFGGLVALRFAARYPARTQALVLVSTPGPRWRLRARHEVYARWPRVLGALFLAETPWRVRHEIRTALPDRRARRHFRREVLRTLVTAPLSVSRMAVRARLAASHDRLTDCAAVSCPTLVVHGDQALDHVVHVGGTAEYATLIRGARSVTLEQTGHLGSLTRPHELAAIINRFLAESRQTSHGSAA
jgi:pimeloyl-ACP methyl ester carboxylesterase